jgi:NADH pyrophosphatase NudC (nudix superfamily)
MQKLSRKAIEKKRRQNSQTITNIIANTKNNQVSPSDLKEIRVLLADSQKLTERLHPNINIPSNYKNDELSKIEAKYDSLHGFISKEPRCGSCGEPYRNNKVNGKPWCSICNKPFKVADKNVPIKKPLPKTVYVTEEEFREFESKMKKHTILKLNSNSKY